MEQRETLARRVAVLGVLYQFAYAGSQLVGLGIIARHVDAAQYGLWITVFAITTWAPLASLGQYAVMLSSVGATARIDHEETVRSYSAALVLVVPLTALLLVLLFASALCSPWATILNVSNGEASNAVTLVAISAIGVSLAAVPPTLAGYVVFAHQRGDYVHMSMIAGSLFAVGALALAALTSQALWVLGMAAVAGPLLGGMLIWSFNVGGPLLPRPSWKSLRRDTVLRTFQVGARFLVIDLLLFAVVRTPEFLVAQIHGAQAVGAFGSVGRFPVMLLAIFQALLLPYWPALAAAASSGDHAWIRRIARRSLFTLLAMWIVAAVLLPTLGPSIISVWLGRTDLGNVDLLLAAGMQALGLALLAWMQLLLSALSRERSLVVALFWAVLAYLVAAFWAGHAWGPVGVALAQAFALIAVALPLALPAIRGVLRQQQPTREAPMPPATDAQQGS